MLRPLLALLLALAGAASATAATNTFTQTLTPTPQVPDSGNNYGVGQSGMNTTRLEENQSVASGYSRRGAGYQSQAVDPNDEQKPTYLWQQNSITVSLAANTPVFFAAIWNPTTVAKTVKIQHIEVNPISVACSATVTAVSVNVDLVVLTGVPTATITPVVAMRQAQADGTAVIFYDDMTGAAGLTAAVAPVGPRITLNNVNAATLFAQLGTVLFPAPLYRWMPVAYRKPLTIRANVAEGFGLQAVGSANTIAITYNVLVVWTEE